MTTRADNARRGWRWARVQVPRRAAHLLPGALLALGLALAGCRQDAPPAAGRATAAAPGADTPAGAVQLLTGHLRAGDLSAFARDATPAALQPALEQAWRDGGSRWPLSELPLAPQFPAMLAGLAAPQSERTLLVAFNHQFAGAERELRAAAESLGVFAIQYLEHDPAVSDGERDHYSQVVTAISLWAHRAPLADRAHAQAALALLAPAARTAGLDSDAAFAEAGMHGSLHRLQPVIVAAKQALLPYGLDLDAALASVEATLQTQTGDTAQVRMRYTLAGQPIDVLVAVERHDGRWFVSDFLRNAEAAAATSAPDPPAAPEPADAPAGPPAAGP
ncbi:hypothetical protein LDO26_12900 [Luteimonas sp. BDR2-5]|uniref:hypothetical protein n=1 Tax=Proluteimonas luteida TaxID=2878685 RepID=UPI001E36A17D|nr:hypothetical protein [Luteimonas sp. BDR2-5]MCD9029098.1 hypothetical protein [Luteimonas sp. BDR2-5]